MHMYRHGLATFVFSTCLSLICAARDNDVIQLGMRLLLSFVSPLFSLTLLHGHAARQPDGKVAGMLHPCHVTCHVRKMVWSVVCLHRLQYVDHMDYK